MMDADEREIFYFLRSERHHFVPIHTISRLAGGRQKFRENPDWARPPLMRMVERGILEIDSTGAYRLKPIPKPDANTQRWISPQIAELLRRSGKRFDGVIAFNGDEEAYYDSL